ncbi:hypothetical protein [Burkholderia ambifaria]|uniref:Lipoprotein n=1 Tax=Burkholderia ambifaria MEX-5 TaxID=396597 RepID=B1TBB9_9BURK|nr:hypothetical protein [Burkholderia ambifaria]EDT39143.1 conserved hypothetical protein [Burkholderia ambifaria MEX-5]
MIRPSIDQGVGRLISFVAFSFVMLLTGCAELPMSTPKPTIENAARLRSGTPALAAMDVGEFRLDASQPASVDRGISIRSNMVRSPVRNSFAQYLRETLKVELQSAGLLNPSSDTVVTGSLLTSSVEAPVGIGRATLSARFVVTRAATVQYERVLSENAQWDSPFMGVSAIPQAAGQYESLYRRLIGLLLDDPAFRAAVSIP